MQQLDELDRALLQRLQGDLPLMERPFAAWANELGVSQEELLARIASLERRGIIRKFKGILRHQRAGMRANAMVAWAVAPEETARCGAAIAAHPAVTHCYERPAFQDYRIFSMLHGRNTAEVESFVCAIAAASGCDNYCIYWSERELKKTSMRYFETNKE